MTGKERIDAVMNWQKPDRLPVYEHMWSETIQLWQTQGCPADVDLHDHFEWDLQTAGWFELTPQLPVERLAEDEEYITERNTNGVVLKRHKSETGHTPLWLEYTLKDRNSWESLRDRFTMNDSRLSDDVVQLAQKARGKGRYVCLSGCDPYEAMWQAFGQVNIFTLMMDDPDVVADVASRLADMIIGIVDGYHKKGVPFDAVFFYGDMGYRNGTLFSPDCYDQFLAEPHKRLCDYVHSINKRAILHSCGMIKSFIPRFIDAGFDAIQPLEAKCDQDVRDLREKHGRNIVLFGNMDVRKWSGAREEVKEETLGKLEAVAHEGGYIFHSDHSVPPTVSYENYCYALELARNFQI